MDRLQRLIEMFPDIYKPARNPILNGLLQAVADEDERASNAILDAREQIFVKTAVKKFLDYLAANVSVLRPTMIKFIDDKFRQLIPVLSYWPKQVKPSIYKCLELFWSIDYLHSTIKSLNPQTYDLSGGETLTFLVDETHEVSVTFIAADFATPGAATAQEICNKINAWLPDYVIAYVYFDKLVGRNFVRVSTNTYGIAGSMQVLGGTANGQMTTGTVTGSDPVAGAILTQAVSGATGKILNFGVGTFITSDVSGIFDTSHVITGVNPDLSTFTFTPSLVTTGINFSANKIQYTRVSLHELKPNELIVRIPKKIILNMDNLLWAHRFHADSTIIDGRPNVDSAHPYWPGGFFYDRRGPTGTGTSVRLYSTRTKLVSHIAKGFNYSHIDVTPGEASFFPDTQGYIVFDFGLDHHEVVRYLRRPNNNTLQLDSTYTFQHSHLGAPAGETINLCSNIGQCYEPRPTGIDYPIFFLDTEIGMQLTQSFVLLLKAAGIIVRWVLEDE